VLLLDCPQLTSAMATSWRLLAMLPFSIRQKYGGSFLPKIFTTLCVSEKKVKRKRIKNGLSAEWAISLAGPRTLFPPPLAVSTPYRAQYSCSELFEIDTTCPYTCRLPLISSTFRPFCLPDRHPRRQRLHLPFPLAPDHHLQREGIRRKGSISIHL
jgi:hypothetical protein